MIIWIRGQRGAGKTTLAKELRYKIKGSVLLDGDDMRMSISTDLGFSDTDRLENNKRIAKLAKILNEQGHDVIVATICPGKIKQEVYYICKCKFIDL